MPLIKKPVGLPPLPGGFVGEQIKKKLPPKPTPGVQRKRSGKKVLVHKGEGLSKAQVEATIDVQIATAEKEMEQLDDTKQYTRSTW